ncbi:hypothetical protein EGR_10612 [Echinococcus granulosus]|uniref:Uncharacterized protein n=1 Tax=Echinococcus granulosus TaxID=6210 RepID=W6U0H4_ECHGR|nr:hypothetical protein EGR_10612 [Echinococcus granulosus]EUB54528.1 hypothetical protein EGR_10612 [Echinococcus granulosus]
MCGAHGIISVLVSLRMHIIPLSAASVAKIHPYPDMALMRKYKLFIEILSIDSDCNAFCLTVLHKFDIKATLNCALKSVSLLKWLQKHFEKKLAKIVGREERAKHPMRIYNPLTATKSCSSNDIGIAVWFTAHGHPSDLTAGNSYGSHGAKVSLVFSYLFPSNEHSQVDCNSFFVHATMCIASLKKRELNFWYVSQYYLVEEQIVRKVETKRFCWFPFIQCCKVLLPEIHGIRKAVRYHQEINLFQSELSGCSHVVVNISRKKWIIRRMTDTERRNFDLIHLHRPNFNNSCYNFAQTSTILNFSSHDNEVLRMCLISSYNHYQTPGDIHQKYTIRVLAKEYFCKYRVKYAATSAKKDHSGKFVRSLLETAHYLAN